MSYQYKNPDEQYSKADEGAAFHRALQAFLNSDKGYPEKDFQMVLDKAIKSTLGLGESFTEILRNNLRDHLSNLSSNRKQRNKLSEEVVQKAFRASTLALYYHKHQQELLRFTKEFPSHTPVQNSLDSGKNPHNLSYGLMEIFNDSLVDVLNKVLGAEPYSIITKFGSLSNEECENLYLKLSKEVYPTILSSNHLCIKDKHLYTKEWLRKNFDVLHIFISEHARNLVLPSLGCRQSLLKIVFKDLIWIAISLSKKEKISLYVEVTETDLNIRTVCFSSKSYLQYDFRYYYSSSKYSLAELILAELKGCSFRSVMEEGFCILTEVTIPLTLLC